MFYKALLGQEISAQLLGKWKLLKAVAHEMPELKRRTTIFLYEVDKGIFAGYLPINNYCVTASSEAECVNECKAECDRYLAKEEVFDDIPF